MTAPLFKVMTADQWAAFQAEGRFEGGELDRQDGYIHMSASDQVAGVVHRYFADKPALLVLAIDRAPINRLLKWEQAKDGHSYPHYYGVFDLAWVLSADALPDDPDQRALALALIAV